MWKDALDCLVCLSDFVVLFGAALEYWDIKHETSITPGRLEVPQVFGDPIFGRWIDSIFPTREKQLAALGWKILTGGLACELVFTSLLFIAERSDDRNTAGRISSQERRIEQLETRLNELRGK